MKRVTKVCLVLFAALVAGALLLLLCVNHGGSVAFPALPSPNGYDDFVAAGNLLCGQTNDALEMSAEQLRAFIATNSESLRLLQLGLSRTCSVHTAEFLTNNPALASDAFAIKRLAQLGVAVGRSAELEGRTNDAIATYLTGMHYGNEISRGGLIIHRLVGIACEKMASSRLTSVLTKLNASDLSQTILALEQMEAEAVSWTEIRENERVLRRQTAQWYWNPIRLVQAWWSARSMLKYAEVKCLEERARRRLLITELALRCHASAHGAPPKQLDDLVPEYLAHVPLDPFTGQALVYHPSGANWLLYSVGADGVDDGGTPVLGGLGGKSARGDLRNDTP